MGAPMVWDFVKKDEDRKLLRLLMTAQTVGRPYVMPPGSPPEAVAIIRKAFDQAVKDPKFLEDAARATLEVAPVNAARMREILAESYGASPELIQRARQALQ
jgi:tripartite-type tricarboxylate transporter receptor subunit TctC